MRPRAAAFQLMREDSAAPPPPTLRFHARRALPIWRSPTPTWLPQPRSQSGQFSMALSAHFQRIFLDLISIWLQQRGSFPCCSTGELLSPFRFGCSFPSRSSRRARCKRAIRNYAALRPGTTKDTANQLIRKTNFNYFLARVQRSSERSVTSAPLSAFRHLPLDCLDDQFR